MRYSSRTNCEAIDNLAEALQDQENMPEIARRVLEFEAENAKPENALCQHGLPHTKKAASQIAGVRDKHSEFYDNALLDLVEEWLKTYEEAKKLTHRERRQEMEDKIRVLQPVLQAKGKDADPRFLSLLARIYLYRGMLFRPKGFTTPARKIEALKKAVQLSEKAVEKEKDNPNFLRTWAQAALELEAIPETSFKVSSGLLKDAAVCINRDGIHSLNDLQVILEYAESEGKTSFLQHVLVEKRYWKRPFDLFLLKARAAFALNRMDDVRYFLKSAMDKTPKALSSPFWDHLVDFLKKLRTKEGSDLWKEMAVAAHRLCREKEVKIANNIYLYRHWARQKSLYNMAFLAQNDLKEKAKIADSLKSRPVLRYQALREMKEHQNIAKLLEQDDQERDGGYHKQQVEMDERTGKRLSEKMEKAGVSYENLPVPWISVHFYLNESENSEDEGSKGYALIFDALTQSWKERRFDYAKLHRKFMTWQEAYISAKKSSFAKDSLVELCREIGNTMPFLFDTACIRDGAPVLWIPHGFLHRLPLHAAIRDEATNEIFLEKHASRYLPAWSILNSASARRGKDSYMIKRFRAEDYEKEPFSELEDMEWDNEEHEKLATPDDLKHFMAKNPGVFAVLCHGHGDILNPLKSWLELEGGGFSVLDILKYEEANLSGARVLLGACEADMAPPVEYAIDEHVSLSAAFLSHKAREVIAGLWEINITRTDICYTEVRDSDDLSLALKKWQKKQLKIWKKNQNNKIFYWFTPFRIMGFPLKLKDNNESEAKQ